MFLMNNNKFFIKIRSGMVVHNIEELIGIVFQSVSNKNNAAATV
jgi:hypothetical protein